MSTHRCAFAALAVVALASSGHSPARAQPAEADAPVENDEEGRSRLIKPEGEGMDNEQLGGEPSLTEPQPEPSDEEKEPTVELGEETGSVTEEVHDDIGDAQAAEPTTTPIDRAAILKGSRLPTRLGPVRIRVGKTDDWIGIGFAAQVEFESDTEFESAGFPKASDQFLEFRRIRLTISSSFIDGRIRSRFQVNFTPSAFDLIDMWFAFTRFKYATFRIGQFKIPFDRYRATSYAALSLIDWPPTTRMFGSGRQIGAEMYARGLRDVEYAFGVFSGTSIRAAHGIGIIEVYGEKPRNRSNIGAGQRVSEFHPELVGRFAKNFGEINTDFNSDVLGTKKLRQSVGAGFAWDARPKPIEDLALRLSVEWLAKISGVHINLINYLAWYEPWEGGRIQFGPIGAMGEVGYRFSALWELAMRYAIWYLTPQLRDDARSYGQFQISVAEDPAEAIAQYGRNGDQKTNSELALAGTAHIIGNSLRVVAQAAWLSQLWNTGLRNGIRINMQLQILF